MGLTVVPGTMIEDGTVTDTNFTNTTITSTDMALDPRNASNISSGSVPLAQLGNVPAADLTGLDDDIALLGFKTAANGSLAKYNLLDQTVDAFEDASGVDASASTDENRDSTGKYYSGTLASDPTGGTVTTFTQSSVDYKCHTFLTSSNFVAGVGGNVEYLVVAGGGGGGSDMGGGGGAGGYLTNVGGTSLAISAATHTVTVGAGGPGSPAGGLGAGTAGGDSVFGSYITSIGGGQGASNHTGTTPSQFGGDGGSGGGATSYRNNYGGDGTPGQGYPGGDSAGGSGGGGAAAAGTDGASPANGGAGLQSNIDNLGGAAAAAGGYYYAGGGGGNTYNVGGGAGAIGGGGGGGANGGITNPGGNSSRNAGSPGAAGPAGGHANLYGGPAGANTGGGGGGGSHYNSNNQGGNGGTGIVIIRYVAGSFIGNNNMTLVSNLTAAQAAPTKGDIVFTYTNGAGTAVINTNITAEISADDGSTWTTFSGLTSQGTTGGHTIVSAHDQTITSTITAPYNMRYRIKTLVQSAAMSTRIQAVSLGWS